MGCGASQLLSKTCCDWKVAEEPIVYETDATDGTASTCLIMAHGFSYTGRSIRGSFETLFADQYGLRTVLPTAPQVRSAYSSTNVETGSPDDASNGAIAKPVSSMASLANSLLSTSAPTVNSWCDDVPLESVDDMVTGTSPAYIESFETGEMHCAIEYIHDLIRQQIRDGIHADQIIVGGHGQGGFLASRAVLSFPDAKLGGLWVLGGFIGGVELQVCAVQRGLRVLFTHGGKDPIVSSEAAEAGVARLQRLFPHSAKQGLIQYVNYEEMDHFPFDAIGDRESELSKLLLESIGKVCKVGLPKSVSADFEERQSNPAPKRHSMLDQELPPCMSDKPPSPRPSPPPSEVPPLPEAPAADQTNGSKSEGPQPLVKFERSFSGLGHSPEPPVTDSGNPAPWLAHRTSAGGNPAP